MPATLVVGDWHAGCLTLSRRCAAVGREVHLLEIVSTPHELSPRSRCVATARPFAASMLGTAEGIEIIRARVRAVGADSIHTQREDVSVWLADQRPAFGPGCAVLTPPAEVLRALSSKRAQVALALDAGFEVLDTWLLTSVDDVGAIPRDRYPIALRPDDPTRVRPRLKIKVVHSPEEATAFVSGLQQIRCPIVAQPFLRAPNLVVHGVRAVDGELLALEAFLVARKYRAVTLTIERTAFPPGIEAACRFFADRAQLAGPFHYELLLLDGGRRAAFLEVNVRLGGTTDKVTRLGFDEPLLMLRAFGLLAPEACEQRHVRAGFAVNRRMILEHMAMAALGRVNECDYPQVGRLRHLAMDVDALLRGSDSVLGLGDACGSRSMYAVDRLRRLVRLPRGRTLRAWR